MLEALRGRRQPRGCSQKPEGSGVREGVRHHGGSQCLEGKPQERDRDETSSAGRAGSKASRGCETLRAQPDRWDGSRRVVWLRAAGKTLKGNEPRTERGGAQRESAGGRHAVSTGETVKGSPSLRGDPPDASTRRVGLRCEGLEVEASGRARGRSPTAGGRASTQYARSTAALNTLGGRPSPRQEARPRQRDVASQTTTRTVEEDNGRT